MTVFPITDPLDARIAPYRAVRERDVAGREGGFIAEGEVVVRMLASSRLHHARSLLIAADRLTRLADLMASFPTRIPVYAATQPVMDAIVGFPIHRGVLAYGRRGPGPCGRDLLGALGPRALVLALVGISNHDNIGGIFRNAVAFGVDAVLIDPTCCDPLYRKAIRVSVGAALVIPFARWEAGEEPIDLLEAAGFTPLALSPSGATRLAALRRPSRAAVILGAEGAGLPAAILDRARTISIPMAGGFDSLNVATASGIVLYHLASAGSVRAASISECVARPNDQDEPLAWRGRRD